MLFRSEVREQKVGGQKCEAWYITCKTWRSTGNLLSFTFLATYFFIHLLHYEKAIKLCVNYIRVPHWDFKTKIYWFWPGMGWMCRDKLHLCCQLKWQLNAILGATINIRKKLPVSSKIFTDCIAHSVYIMKQLFTNDEAAHVMSWLLIELC